jgi:hypothetical protein
MLILDDPQDNRAETLTGQSRGFDERQPGESTKEWFDIGPSKPEVWWGWLDPYQNWFWG